MEIIFGTAPRNPDGTFERVPLNQGGICHAISCQWVKKSKELRRPLINVEELGLIGYMAINQRLAETWQSINENYHLNTDNVIQTEMVNRQQLVDVINTHNGYALIIFWGVSGGHTVAVCCKKGNIQYFDPNIGLITFDNSEELYDWILNENGNNPFYCYPEFTISRCEFVKV